jgi:hypothetical protein
MIEPAREILERWEPPATPVILGECVRHGWHGRTVCPTCREQGAVALEVRTNIRRLKIVEVNSSLLRFRGGGREKVRQEARCRMCLRSKGPDSRKEWEQSLPIAQREPDHMHNVLLGELPEPKFVGSRSLTRHHLVPEYWFKKQPPATRAVRSVDANIIPLCRPCHEEVERDKESRRMLRRVLGAEEVAFAIQIATVDWFNSRYPSLG